MTENEVIELHIRFRRYRRPEDGDVLLKHHHGFAVQIARRHVGAHLSFEDAVSTAIRGLYEALKRYDPEYGAFTTFAYWWIFKLITIERTFSKNVVRIPTKVMRQSRRVQRLMADGWLDDEIAEEMLMDVDEVKRLSELHLLPTGKHIEQDDEGTVDAKIDDEEVPEITQRDLMLQRLEKAMQKLDKRAQHIVRSRNTAEPMSFSKLGKLYGLSRQRVREIYTASVKKLQWHCRKL